MSNTCVRLERDGELALVVVHNPPVNTINADVRTGLVAVVDEIRKDAGIRGVILLCEGSTFFSGADIGEFRRQFHGYPITLDRFPATSVAAFQRQSEPLYVPPVRIGQSVEIGEPPRIGNVRGERLQVVGHQRRQRHDLLEIRLDVALQRIDLQPVVFLEHLGRFADAAAKVRTRRGDLFEAHAGQALHDDAEAAVGQLEHLVDLAGGTDRMQVGL